MIWQMSYTIMQVRKKQKGNYGTKANYIAPG